MRMDGGRIVLREFMLDDWAAVHELRITAEGERQ
jgi:hypothetical protein